MSRKDFYISTEDDGSSLAIYQWQTEEPLGVILLLHGMAEHALRYEYFSQRLAESGWEVFACDLRGHGKSALSPNQLGFFPLESGWQKVTKDILFLADRIKKDYPDLPLVLFGHSMGSFLARTCLALDSKSIAGFILMGTSLENSLLLRISHLFAHLLIFFQGAEHRSILLNILTFGSFNRRFTPTRTTFDWLSRDELEVDLYCEDPLCGFLSPLNLYKALFTGLLFINLDKPLADLPSKPPVLLLSGTSDPVSHQGKDIIFLADRYTCLGFGDVSTLLYTDARHELLHEQNKDEVIRDILTWLNRHWKKQ